MQITSPRLDLQHAAPLEVEKNFFGQEMLDLLGVQPIPYATRLSFAPIIRSIRQQSVSNDSPQKAMAQMLLDQVDMAPELHQPIENTEVLEKHCKLTSLLVGAVMPMGNQKQLLAKISKPFSINPLYISPALKQLITHNEVVYDIKMKESERNCAMMLHAGLLILNRHYGYDIKMDYPVMLTVRNNTTGLDRHFKINVNLEQMDVVVNGDLPKLTDAAVNEMLNDVYNHEAWMKLLPPEKFAFHGLAMGQFVEYTEAETMSRLKDLLLKPDALVSREHIDAIQHLLRNYFRMTGLQMGIAAVDYPGDATAAYHRYNIRFNLLKDAMPVLLADSNEGSIYDEVCRDQQMLLIGDLNEHRYQTPAEQQLLDRGIRSMMVAALTNQQGNTIGIVELAVTRPNMMNSLTMRMFDELIPLFNQAIARSRDEMDNRIEALIRETYTAIHPSVEWRFIEASHRLLQAQEVDPDHSGIEQIVFKDVYPLYAQADISRSSEQRNRSIQADLVRNLELLEQTFARLKKKIEFPLLRQFSRQVATVREEISAEFNSNDESRVIDLLHGDFHPFLQQLAKDYASTTHIVQAYFKKIDPELGVLYHERKAYEDSVSMINKTISGFLTEQQRRWQKVLPHYFEKYKTDGVEYDIYVGQSLLQQGTFQMAHLRNFRLWQLLDMVEVTRKVNQLQQVLPVPLTTAQLIFVYSNSLSIRFRMDEKQFDVDGAYNVRYEILKKRIDKALIEGTAERLTQPGKIAIVYLQEKDRKEYMDYLTFLQQEGLITDLIEDFKLDKLQGVQGLRALRVTVVTD